MTTIALQTFDHALAEDDDTWIDFCTQCGTLDNFGELECSTCDHHH